MLPNNNINLIIMEENLNEEIVDIIDLLSGNDLGQF